MKRIIVKFALPPILLALALTGCSLEVPSDPTGDVNPPGAGDASTAYVAIGNSLTAGFMDSGLMVAGQANSYPMIVATQMGLEDFSQPYVDFPGIGTTNVGPGQVSGVLYYDGASVLPRGTTPEDQTAGLLLAVAQPVQYHNLGVPGAFSFDLMSTYSAATSYAAAPPFSRPNSFFEFINRAGPLVGLFGNVEVPLSAGPPPVTTWSGSQFYQTVAKGPALVTAWIGGNDFLFGATSGDPQGPANALITPAATFAQNYGTFMHSLAGALLQRNGFAPTIITATLPHIRNIPYFLDRPTFEAVFGGLGHVYEEADAEYVLFTNFLSSGLPTTPGGTLPANMTLSAAERAYLDDQVIGAYNTAIQTVVAQINGNTAVPATAAFVDFNAAMDDARGTNPDAFRHFLFLRITTPGESIAETAARTYFSLDGVHPNNQGYVFVANEFIEVINATLDTDYAALPPAAVTWDPTYGATVKTLDHTGGIPRISPEVAEAMRMSFR